MLSTALIFAQFICLHIAALHAQSATLFSVSSDRSVCQGLAPEQTFRSYTIVRLAVGNFVLTLCFPRAVLYQLRCVFVSAALTVTEQVQCCLSWWFWAWGSTSGLLICWVYLHFYDSISHTWQKGEGKLILAVSPACLFTLQCSILSDWSMQSTLLIGCSQFTWCFLMGLIGEVGKLWLPSG